MCQAVRLAPVANLKPASATLQTNNQLMAQADLSADAKAVARSQAIESLSSTQKRQEILNNHSSMLLAGFTDKLKDKTKGALNRVRHRSSSQQQSSSSQQQSSSHQPSATLQRAQEDLRRRGGDASAPRVPSYTQSQQQQEQLPAYSPPASRPASRPPSYRSQSPHRAASQSSQHRAPSR